MSYHMHFVFSLLPALGMPLLPTVTPNPLLLTSSGKRSQTDVRVLLRVFRYSHPPMHEKSAHVAVVGLVEINWEDFRANGATYKLTAISQAIYGCRNFHFISRFVSKNVCQLATEILIIKLKIQLRNTGFIALLSWSRGTLVILLFTNNLKLFINYLDKLFAQSKKKWVEEINSDRIEITAFDNKSCLVEQQDGNRRITITLTLSKRVTTSNCVVKEKKKTGLAFSSRALAFSWILVPFPS